MKFLKTFISIVVVSCLSALADIRTYEGTINGNVFGISQTAKVSAEIAGQTNGSEFIVRGKLLEPLPFLTKTNWSNKATIYTTNNPTRISVSKPDYSGRVGVYHSQDWKSITLAATGVLYGVPVTINQSTLNLISVVQDSQVISPTNVFGLKQMSVPCWIGGPVNFWFDVDAAQWASSLYKNNAFGAIIEFRGPSAQFGVGGTPNFPDLLVRLNTLAVELEKRGLWLWIIDANWNSPYKKNPISSFTSEASQILAVCRQHKNIIIQPVSERTSNKSGVDLAKADQIFKYYEANFSGPMAWFCANENEPCPSRYAIADYHVSSTSEKGGKAGRFNTTSTDHSAILAELHDGNGEGQVANLNKLIPFATSIKNANRMFVWYEFFHKQPDYASYNALGKIFTSSGQVVIPTPAISNKVVDALDITGHRSGYKHRSTDHADKIPITRALTDATKDGDKIVYAKVNRTGWPTVTEKKACNGQAWLFWVEADGSVFGDHYDWLSVDQYIKGLENIHAGIFTDSNGVVHIPPKGARIFTCQTSTDFKERTPVVEVKGLW